MSTTPSSILAEMERLQKSLIKIEYKSRRLFEESGGNPPPETILQYDMYMMRNGAKLQELRKELERFYPVPL
jgi:hypothetical protein